MTNIIYIQPIEKHDHKHYKQIAFLYHQSLLKDKHEPLNEVMLLSLIRTANSSDAREILENYFPDATPKYNDTNICYLPSIQFSYSFFAYAKPEVGLHDLDDREQYKTSSSDYIMAYDSDQRISPDDAIGYMQLSYGHKRWHLATILNIEKEVDRLRLMDIFLKIAIAYVEENGGGTIQLFAPKAPSTICEAAQKLLFIESSVVLCMHKHLEKYKKYDSNLNLSSSVKKNISPVYEIRTFRIGHDEQIWLDLNNRAFESHADQGKWNRDDILWRECLSWFDPNGFFLLEIDTKLAGFCWTKIIKTQPNEHPRIGEIYILAIDADWQGYGLGEKLLLKAISYLAEQGVEICSLYCESSNVPAIRLYESMGFTCDHKDILYTLDTKAVG